MTARGGRLTRYGSALVELCYPVRCWGCGLEWPRPGELLCEECHQELVGHELIRCGRCGQFVGAGALVGGGCWECRDRRFAFTTATAAVPYSDAAREMVHGFKFSGHGHLAALMAELMAEVARQERLEVLVDLVVPVPLHWRRRLGRGYDQSAVLAQRVGRKLGLPVEGGVVVRRRATAPQSGLSRAERMRNVAGSFTVRRAGAVAERTALLVDDVLTTGATADACSRALVEAGAVRVFVLTFARAGKPIPVGVGGARSEDDV